MKFRENRKIVMNKKTKFLSTIVDLKLQIAYVTKKCASLNELKESLLKQIENEKRHIAVLEQYNVALKKELSECLKELN